MLKENGRAAVVVPDNVLFEGGAGERIRRALLERCDIHTLLPATDGHLVFVRCKSKCTLLDKKPATKTPATKEVWVYDLRSNRNFSLRQNPIGPEHLTDFVRCYRANDPTRRMETTHFRRFTYSEIMTRDKASLDIQWQQETTNSSERESPQTLMKKILEDLAEAMKEFAAAEAEILR